MIWRRKGLHEKATLQCLSLGCGGRTTQSDIHVVVPTEVDKACFRFKPAPALFPQTDRNAIAHSAGPSKAPSTGAAITPPWFSTARASRVMTPASRRNATA